jgi:DNA polymerase-4
MAKIIMHIDLNAFFASAEVIKDPSLEGKPLIVAGTSRRGIVSTSSYEARKFGIYSGMPTYMARRLCKDVVIKSCDFAYYHTLSQQFFAFIKEITPLIEIASVDECYADMTEVMKDVKDPYAYLKNLQNHLLEQTKLRCSIGLAPTKFLAKMGSDYQKPMGITIIRRKDVKNIIYPLPLKDMYGIGKKTYPKLENIGIKTIGDLMNSSSPDVKKILGKSYDTFMMWGRGYGDDQIITESSDPKSIGRSSTFLFDTNDYEEIKEKLYLLCQDVVSSLKKEDKIASCVNITIKDSSFRVFNKSKTIASPSEDFDIFFQTALKLYEDNFATKEIRLIGISLSSLMDKDDFHLQLNFFNIEEQNKKCEVKLLINKINNKMGKKVLKTAKEYSKEKSHESK